MPSPAEEAIPCQLTREVRDRIEGYAAELIDAAPGIGTHGLAVQEFWSSGIFRAAIEKIRGAQAASMTEKREFVASAMNVLLERKLIDDWRFTGAADRHDYQVRMPSGRLSIIETKGCLDGNNTNIFERPPQADEFVIWSLCQNPGSDPRHNAWSGIHTRLGAEVIHREQRVDGLVIWDMLCGTAGRPCPKLSEDSVPGTSIAGGRLVPPPCLYLFPRTLPDPRNNPSPATWDLRDVHFLQALSDGFGCRESDVVKVAIEARRSGATLERRTSLSRSGDEVAVSEWTELRRARR